MRHKANEMKIVFEDKALADNVVIAVEKQIHYASTENLARQEIGETVQEVEDVQQPHVSVTEKGGKL